MAIQVITDPRLIQVVQENMDKNPHRSYLYHAVNDILEGRTCYLLGGAVRDPIVRLFYGNGEETNDFDFLVDDSQAKLDVMALFEGERNVDYNRFGTVKWKPAENIEIDVSTFTNANALLRGIRAQPSLELYLSSCEFNTGSIAYGLRDHKIYDFKAIEGIRTRTVNILDPADLIDLVPVNLARLILHSDKLGFQIGPGGINFIQNYSPEMDEIIKEYLQNKGKPEKFEKVIERLREIKQS